MKLSNDSQNIETSMNEKPTWARLSCAAAIIDVSDDTILRRAVLFVGKPSEIHLHPCPAGRIRFLNLKLGEKTRQERRYYVPDLMQWLK